MKISLKIVLSFLIVYAVASSFTGYFVGVSSVNIVKSQMYSYIFDTTLLHARQINTFLAQQKEAVAMISSERSFATFLRTPKTSKQYVAEKTATFYETQRIASSSSAILEVFLLDIDGNVVVSSNIVEQGLNKSNRQYFLEGKKRIYVQDIYRREDGVISYVASSPIIDLDSGNILGVLAIRYNPKGLFEATGSSGDLDETEESFLINKNKYFITPSKFLGDSVILKEIVDTENTRQCFNEKEIAYVNKYGYEGMNKVFGSQIVDAKDYRGIDIIGSHAYIPETGWCMITKMDKSEIFKIQDNIARIFGLIFFIAFFVFVFLGILVSRILVSPINKLRSVVSSIESGNLDVNIDIKSKDEIGNLAEGFKKMVSALKGSKENIEKQVQEKTLELSRKTSSLEAQSKAMINVLQDINIEKESSKRLAEDLLKFKMAVDNASDHVLITDADANTLYANHSAELITGYSIDEMVGKKAGVLWHLPMPKEFYEKMWHTIKDEKTVFIGQLQNKRKNGEIYDANVDIIPIPDKDGNIIFYVGIERDITREKQIDRAKTEFVSLASHQLKTPLTAINWYIELLLSGKAGGETNDTQKKYLNEVYRGSRRMVDLVNSLLNVSRIELGTFTVEPQLTDIRLLADNAAKELLNQIEKKKINFVKQYDSDLPMINIDQKLMWMVFQNLLSNAVKYTSDGGSVSLTIAHDAQNIYITVADSGFGIPVEDQSRIFSKLFRASNAIKKEQEGTGLGLYIVKSIIETAGGKIWFTSEVGKGTTFFVTLPLEGMKETKGAKSLE